MQFFLEIELNLIKLSFDVFMRILSIEILKGSVP